MASTVYQFSDFALDLSQKRLCRNDQEIELQRLSFVLLAYLIQHRDRVIGIDELQDAVWGTVVTDAAVARAIMKVRKALDDDPAQPQLIRTVVRHGYQFIGTLSEEPEKTLNPTNIIKDNSIAVLPLVNMSGDPDNEYFGDGIAEEILNLLARVPDLRVTSRTSSFAFKNKQLSTTDIAEILRVRYTLEGSVRRFGDRVRITMQLIDCDADNHLWSETYEEQLVDVFEIQDRIARRVADSLDAELTRSTRQQSTTNPRAYDFYLRGRELFHRTDLGKMELAKQMFKRATNVDGGFAQAWAGLSYACSWLHMWLEQSQENLTLSRSAAERAVEINPQLAEGHTALGFGLTLANEFDQAAEAFESAIRLDPKLYEAWYLYGRARFAEGKTDLAQRLFEQAAECQPDEYQASCLALNSMKKGSEAIKTAATKAVARVKNHLELYPGDTRALTLGGGALADMGEHEQAWEMAERALKIGPEDISVLHNAGCIFASIGKIDRALDTFEKRLTKSMLYREWIENDPDFEPLRDHPRFIAMLADAEKRFSPEDKNPSD